MEEEKKEAEQILSEGNSAVEIQKEKNNVNKTIGRKVFIRTFGWPMVTLSRDDIEVSKEVEWL